MTRVARVLRGQVLLLEHMRATNRIVAALMDLANPLAVRSVGANINRRTLENIRASGLKVVYVEDLFAMGIARLIEATP